jgi:hypothetical protein
MIFDDHDISDDWYLNQDWCLRVLGKPLGRQIVQNGLLAYALCQAWGNTPAQFEPGTPGDQLLQAVQTWSASAGTDQTAVTTIARLLGLPDPTASQTPFRRDKQVWILDHPPESLQWHYTVTSSCHEVVVLDTRTRRGYPIAADLLAPPMLLSPTAFDDQIRAPLQQTQSKHLQTLVIAPTNLIHLRLIDWIQERSLKQGQVFNHDVGDAWNLHKEAAAELLAALFANREQIVVLSGDIHYGCAAQLNYWSRRTGEIGWWDGAEIKRLVQLTSSALKNAELKTQIVQTKLKSLIPERPHAWVGWHRSPELLEIQTTPTGVRWLRLPPLKPPVIREFKAVQGNLDIAWTIAARDPESLPDWYYRIAWIKRQPAHTPAWGRKIGWLRFRQQRQPSWQRLFRWANWLWSNRWLQEGEEVIGESNIGLVRFQGFPTSGLQDVQPAVQPAQPMVFQDLYWSPPWQPDSIVVSRFEADLQPQGSTAPFPLLYPK